MARYIDADKLLKKAEEIEWFNDGTGYYDLINIVHKYDVETAPTADVVPRAEVERLQAEVDRLKKDNEYILMQHRFQRRPSGDCWNDVIEKAKTEVAREIFEELEYLSMDGRIPMNGYYAELKEKYTREGTTHE